MNLWKVIIKSNEAIFRPSSYEIDILLLLLGAAISLGRSSGESSEQVTQFWRACERCSELERARWSWRRRILHAPAPAFTFSTEYLIFILWLLKKIVKILLFWTSIVKNFLRTNIGPNVHDFMKKSYFSLPLA